MKTSKLLVAAVLAMAIGAPIAGFLGILNVARPMTSTAYGFRSFTDFPPARLPVNPSLLRSSARTSGSIRRR